MGCFLTQLAVDWGLKNDVLGRRDFTSLLDPVAHFTLALLVILPWYSALKFSPRYLILSLAAVIAIDLDHFIAAGSFSIIDAIHLPARPLAHSILFCGFISLLGGLILRSRVAFFVLGAALISHLSRDASGGGITPLFWPSDYVVKIPTSIHLGFWLALSLLGIWKNSKQIPA